VVEAVTRAGRRPSVAIGARSRPRAGGRRDMAKDATLLPEKQYERLDPGHSPVDFADGKLVPKGLCLRPCRTPAAATAVVRLRLRLCAFRGTIGILGDCCYRGAE
jgi:hypothetical protein